MLLTTYERPLLSSICFNSLQAFQLIPFQALYKRTSFTFSSVCSYYLT